MGLGLDDSYRGEVKRVAGVILEGPDAAFAEQQIRVAVGQDIFAGEQPLRDSHRHTTLEQHRFASLGGGDDELEVLGVACPDL